jgi:thymidylate synthase ThyX
MPKKANENKVILKKLFEAEISVSRITEHMEMDIASSATAGKSVKVDWDRMLHSEHSPIRTVMYRIEMKGIPSFVSVHLVRHKIGVEHFVKSLRVDRCGTGNEDRWSPVDHVMILNAQALMNLARRRLCKKASLETQEAMKGIKKAVAIIDPVLARHLVPMCVYRGDVCHEFKSCGYRPHYTERNEE